MTIETKFAPGDEAWIMQDNKPFAVWIDHFQITCMTDGLYQTHTKPRVIYGLKGNAMPVIDEGSLFPTKAELLASL